MRDLEDQEQIALFQWINLNKNKHPAMDLIFHVPNGGLRNIRVAIKMKKMGVKAGVPDIFLPWLRPDRSAISLPTHVGKVFGGMFLEMKSKTGRPTISQAETISKLKAAGYATAVCYGWIEAAELICDYLGIDQRTTGLIR